MIINENDRNDIMVKKPSPIRTHNSKATTNCYSFVSTTKEYRCFFLKNEPGVHKE